MKVPWFGSGGPFAQQSLEQFLVEANQQGVAENHGGSPQVAGGAQHRGYGFGVCLTTAEFTDFFALGYIQAVRSLQQLGGLCRAQLSAGRDLLRDIDVIVHQEPGGPGTTGSAGAVVIPVYSRSHDDTSLV